MLAFDHPRSNSIPGIKTFFVILGFTLLTCVLLLSNPGYFSHDELQKLDIVHDIGLWNYVQTYVSFPSIVDFGTPVRPFSYLVQGLVAVPANKHPFVLHLADVIMHATVGFLVFALVRQVTGNRKFAWIAALIFLISPQTTFAVGWSAALMDRLFTLFGLISCLSAYNYVSGKGGRVALFVLLTSAILSVSSKETGIVFPAMILGYLFVSMSYLKDKKFWIALAVWSLPSIAMLAFKARSLLNSMTGMDSAYTIDYQSVPLNAFVYFAYPFIPALHESHVWPHLASQATMILTFTAHLLLVVLLWRHFSLKAALAYVSAYFLFLLPVITLSMTASHYLYASGVPFGIALAALLVLDGRFNRVFASVFVLVLLSVAVVHNFKVQSYILDTGICSQTLIESSKGVYLSLEAPRELTIVADAGSKAHVLKRIFHNRDRLGDLGPVSIKTLNWDDADAGSQGLRFNHACEVYQLSTEAFPHKKKMD